MKTEMKRLYSYIIILAVILIPSSVFAGIKLETNISQLTTTGSTSSTSTSKQDADSISASEILHGNGSCAGYILGHGNVVQGSEIVFIGVKQGKLNTDYTIDYSSGALYFSEPVSKFESVSVSYKYSKSSSSDRSVSNSGLTLAFGGSSKMNLSYDYKASDSSNGKSSSDMVVYGLNSSMGLGGKSTLSSLFYTATPQDSNRMSLASNLVTSAASTSTTTQKKDKLMLQNADLAVGKMEVKLNYQDVGQNFAGFSSLRDSNAASKDIINQLEKEKGIKRTDIAANMPVGTSANSLSFAMGSIQDNNDEINTKMFGYSGSVVKIDFSNREIGNNFSRFNDLKETDKTQMAAEKGMNRTNYGMQIKTGIASDKNPIWSSIQSTELEGTTGSLSHQEADINLGKVTVQADITSMDKNFNQMSAMSDAEKSRIALISRKQFNPDATSKDVTSADKSQIASEAGLDRSAYNVEFNGSKVNTWLSMTNMDSQNGSLSRQAIQMEGKKFKVYFNHHSIDQGFNKLSSLQTIEKSNFGNEYGMTRTNFGGNFSSHIGNLSFSHSNVVDRQGAGLYRQQLDFQNAKLKLSLNSQDIDSTFSRISDLSDSDKTQLLENIGFRKSEYNLGYQLTNAINFQSYYYDSSNSTNGQTRGQQKNTVTYSPKVGPKVTAFQDAYSYVSDSGNLSNYDRKKVTFDNKFNLLGGLTVTGLCDNNLTQEGSKNPVANNIVQTHVESNQKAKTSFSMDTYNADYGAGSFEQTQGVGVKTKALDNVSLVCSVAQTDKQNNYSETNGSTGLDWTINKDLKMGMSITNKSGGTDGNKKGEQFSLNGLLAKQLLFFNNVNVKSGSNTTELNGKQTACDNSLKIQAGAFDGNLLFDNSDKLNTSNGIYYTSRILQYETQKDSANSKWYHMKFYKQNLVTTTGVPEEKNNYSLDLKCSTNTNFAFTSYFGKDSQSGVYSPVGGSNYKLTHNLNSKSSLYADYTSDLNESTQRHADVFGFGFKGTLPTSAAIDLYCGYGMLTEAGNYFSDECVYKFKFDQKINSSHYISLSAEKKSEVDQTAINPYEGDTIITVDFKTIFD